MVAYSDVSSSSLRAGRIGQGRAFVGREGELKELRSAYEAASLGDGSLVMLVGEPGIGKTTLGTRLAEIVRASGGVTLLGNCYPRGAANLPYQPFVEMFEQYACVAAAGLHAEPGSHAREIGQLLTGDRDQLESQLRAAQEPMNDRQQLFALVLAFFRQVALSRPLLLVLEDLHDADHGTLDLLVYLALRINTCRVLLIGTYRGVEVDREHPLSAALADLRRARDFARLHLSGLSVDDVQRLLTAASGQTVPRPLAELLHRRTEGNPLFVHELLRYLIAERLLEQRDGVLQRVGGESMTGGMPEGLRDTVGRRISRLSDGAKRVLSIASVIGREFDVDVLRRVEGYEALALEQALEEIVAAGILEEHRIVGAKIAFRFTHAFFRQTLYEEIIAPRRIRLHQQIARVLEEDCAQRQDEHAAELAEHFAFSSDPSDLAKALHYAHLAARRANEVFAYAEAARHFERALQVLELIDADDHASRCDLLLELAEALSLAGDTERSVTCAATQALVLADRVGDRHRAFRACNLVAQTLEASGASSAVLSADYLSWAERGLAYAEVGTIEQARANLAVAQGWIMRGRVEEGRTLRVQALALATELGDVETRFQCAFYLTATFGSTAPRYWAERVTLARECATWPRHGASGRVLGRILWHAGRIALAEGDRPRAVARWTEVAELADRTHLGLVELFRLEGEIVVAVLDGHLEDAWTLAERFVSRADEAGASLRGREISMYMFLSLADYLGRIEECLATFENYAAGGLEMNHPLPIAYFVVCLARLGRLEEARARAAPVLERERAGRPDDPRDTNWLVMLLQSAIALEDREAARALALSLSSIAHLSIAEWIPTTVARQLAAAAMLVGETSTARSYYAQALKAAETIGFRPEIAIIHIQLAELLVAEAEYSGALAHLDVCTPELEQMRMRPWLKRAMELRDSAGASARTLGAHGLTRREREVAGLLAEGRSNREIAESLVITEGTAEVHVKRILGKLGLHSRSQVAALMAEHSVISSWPGHRNSAG